jgi:hypothetical protein
MKPSNQTPSWEGSLALDEAHQAVALSPESQQHVIKAGKNHRTIIRISISVEVQVSQ